LLCTRSKNVYITIKCTEKASCLILICFILLPVLSFDETIANYLFPTSSKLQYEREKSTIFRNYFERFSTWHCVTKVTARKNKVWFDCQLLPVLKELFEQFAFISRLTNVHATTAFFNAFPPGKLWNLTRSIFHWMNLRIATCLTLARRKSCWESIELHPLYCKTFCVRGTFMRSPIYVAIIVFLYDKVFLYGFFYLYYKITYVFLKYWVTKSQKKI